MSADQSLKGKGKARRARLWVAKHRRRALQSGMVAVPHHPILSSADTDLGGASIDLHWVMLQGCSPEALESGSRWRAHPEWLFLKGARRRHSKGLAGLPVQAIEDVKPEQAEPRAEDSFKSAFRELRGSIDPDLKLEF